LIDKVSRTGRRPQAVRGIQLPRRVDSIADAQINSRLIERSWGLAPRAARQVRLRVCRTATRARERLVERAGFDRRRFVSRSRSQGGR
jgi:hypothetical protein